MTSPLHASGQPEGLTSALAVAGIEATIVDASWYGSRLVPLPLGEAFHSRRVEPGIAKQLQRLLTPVRAPNANAHAERFVRSKSTIIANGITKDSTMGCALNPRVAPRRVLFRHPDDEATDLSQELTAVHPGTPVRPFPRNELSVPPESRIGRRDRGNVM